MPLLLPKHLVEPPVSLFETLSSTGVYCTFSELTGKASTVAELMAELARLPRTAVIRTLIIVMDHVSRTDGLQHQRQASLAQALIPESLRPALDAWFRKQSGHLH